MKVWATSDLHIDYKENLDWFLQLSSSDYTNDILIIAGDIVHDFDIMRQLFVSVAPKFYKVLFVPGNHDVWLLKTAFESSMEKFEAVLELAQQEGIETQPYISEQLSIVPMHAWYDFSFGQPSKTIQRAWKDFKVCQWEQEEAALTAYFLAMNEAHLNLKSEQIISFSHFLPFKELIPQRVPKIVKALLPVFGAAKLGEQIEQLQPDLHIYGHSHLNRSLEKNGIWYLNNAFGYPHEAHICRKRLVCVYENGQVIKGIKQWPVHPDEMN